MKGEEKHDDIEFCSVCNAAPALFGKDVCLSCQREMLSGRGRGKDNAEEETSIGENTITLNSVSTMDEIIPQIHEDIPEGEFGVIVNELSMKDNMEDEQNDDPIKQATEE